MPRENYVKGTVAERLAAKVDRSSGPEACHPFIGGALCKGYGRLRLGGRGSKHRPAHALAWEIVNGPIPEGKIAIHLCDDRYPVGSIEYRRCCNPAHITAGTDAENMARMALLGRAASGDRHVSRLYPDRVPRGERNGHCLHPERWPSGEAHHSRVSPEGLARGEQNGLAKLTELQAAQAMTLIGEGHTLLSVATRFGVSQTTISRIRRGHTWRHVSKVEPLPKQRRLTPAEVAAIRREIDDGATAVAIARRFRVCPTCIKNIRAGKTFAA